jgi:uracil-DNA glycosylase
MSADLAGGGNLETLTSKRSVMARQTELSRLHDRIRECVRCPLHKNRRHAVPGEGNPHARIVLVGEAPWKTEGEKGRPFLGAAGMFLDRLLADHDLSREEVFLTSSVKCRPHNNREPRPDELGMCRGLWLEPQIDLIDPDIVVLLGKIPIKQVLHDQGILDALHGQIRRKNGRAYQLQYHPAAGRRFPPIGAAMRHDMAKLQRFLDTQPIRSHRNAISRSPFLNHNSQA